MNPKVTFDRVGAVGVITIDNPPINAGSHEVRVGLLEAVKRLAADADLKAGVLIGAGKSFIAGSDLREFGAPLQEPQLPDVIMAIEACPKPVVAALHGAALGGGFELALGCDARITSAKTLVGLPEVTLGIIPGAGGTQRLPRIIGVAKAIPMICSGARVVAEEALALGMIDRIVEGDLRAQAVAFAAGLSGKTLVRNRKTPSSSAAETEAASDLALKVGRGRPAVRAAVSAILNCESMSFDDGLLHERSVFQELRLSREAAALRYLFFAERDSAKDAFSKDAPVKEVRRLGVVGAGTMGAGIAIAGLEGGFTVRLIDREQDALDRGVSYIHAHLNARLEKGKISQGAFEQTLARLHPSTDWGSLSDSDLVIEAVFEDLEVKKTVFQQLQAIVRPDALLASNTSYLDLDEIAGVLERPENFFGLHFFSPAQVMRLLEVVKGARSSPATIATGMSIAKSLRKLPIISANAFGFIGNRIYAAYRRQCELMLEDGAYPDQVDAALETFGFAMGPFAVGDMSGLDIAWRMRKAQAATRDPLARYVEIPDRLCEAGRFGRKTGAGYYQYPAGTKAKLVDPVVNALIDQLRAEKKIAPRALADEEITKRALLAMANEAALLLKEGVSQRPSDVDLVLTNGYGFPRWEGGVVFWARSQGKEQLQADVAWLATLTGHGFRPADMSVLFE